MVSGQLARKPNPINSIAEICPPCILRRKRVTGSLALLMAIWTRYQKTFDVDYLFQAGMKPPDRVVRK